MEIQVLPNQITGYWELWVTHPVTPDRYQYYAMYASHDSAVAAAKLIQRRERCPQTDS